jgi:hypothetical protein
MRPPKIRSRPWLTLGHIGEVVSGNGRVVLITGPHLTKKAAQKAALEASITRKPVVKLVQTLKEGD